MDILDSTLAYELVGKEVVSVFPDSVVTVVILEIADGNCGAR